MHCFVSGSSRKSCDSGLQKLELDATGPTELVRLSVAEANTVMRVRRSLGGGPVPQGRQWLPLLIYPTTENNGDGDQRPYSRSTRNFMRFGRNPSTGNDDIVCLPAVANEEPEVTSAEVDETFTSKDGDEKRFSRFGRDNGQYDYNGKPFMRFGKRYVRRVGRSPEVTGSREDGVVCFRAIVDGRENGKRFMRFGRAFTLDPHDNSQKEDSGTDSGDEKPVMSFGKSSYPVGMGSVADFEKQDEQSKI